MLSYKSSNKYFSLLNKGSPYERIIEKIKSIKEVISMTKIRRASKWTFLLYKDSMPENYLEILERM